MTIRLVFCLMRGNQSEFLDRLMFEFVAIFVLFCFVFFSMSRGNSVLLFCGTGMRQSQQNKRQCFVSKSEKQKAVFCIKKWERSWAKAIWCVCDNVKLIHKQPYGNSTKKNVIYYVVILLRIRTKRNKKALFVLICAVFFLSRRYSNSILLLADETTPEKQKALFCIKKWSWYWCVRDNVALIN